MNHVTAAALMILAIACQPLWAQYPARPIRIIVPLPAGGPSDAAARALGQALAKSFAQPIVIDNRPGVGGAIAAKAALGAAPDGYTLLWGIASMGAFPFVQKSPPFQSLGELAPVSLIGRFAYGVFVHPGVPANSLQDLVRYARGNPGKLSFATGSLGEYMTTMQLLKTTDMDMVRVPYKGGAQAMPDLLAGRVHLFMTPIQLGIQHVREGKLRALAVVSAKRSPLASDVPTLEELGFRGVSTPTWQALFAPRNTPVAVVAKLSGEIIRVLGEGDLRTIFEQQALAVEATGPDVLASVIARDAESWQAFVRENDVPKE